MDVEKYAKLNVQIIETDQFSHRSIGPSDVRVNKACYAEISENKEIKLAVHKRFKGKKTVHGDPTFLELVLWCLSADSYKVCERNLDSVSNVDVEAAWQFIDTASVSSTKACRDVVTPYKEGRSAVGFRREHMAPLGKGRGWRPQDRNTVPSTLVGYSKLDCDGYETLGDLMTEDCMHWVLRSEDPLGSVLRLRSRLLEGGKGGHDLRTHRRGVSS